MCDEEYKIISVDDIQDKVFFEKLSQELLEKMEELISLAQKYAKEGDDMSLREYKRLLEIDNELEFIELHVKDGRLSICPGNCHMISFHFGGLLKHKSLEDSKIYFHFCESDSLVWKYHPADGVFKLISTLPHGFMDKYDQGKDDFIEFCKLLEMNTPEIELVYSPYNEEE